MSVKDYEESLMGGTAAHVSGGPDYLRTLADPDNYHNTRGTAFSRRDVKPRSQATLNAYAKLELSPDGTALTVDKV